jgi:DNA-binding transcriptional ArsR family regulator
MMMQMSTAPEPKITDIVKALGSVPRTLIIRSLSGMATPRSADELAETINITRDQVQEHIDLLVELGVMTLTDPAHAAARPRYLIDQETLRAVLEQQRRYLLND